jgi:hypothetical protein
MFTLRGYRVGREMEATITQTIEAMGQEITQKQQQPPPPDPVEQRRAENDANRLQIENKKVDGELALKDKELGLKQQDIGLKKDTLDHTKGEASYQKQLAMIQELNTMVDPGAMGQQGDPQGQGVAGVVDEQQQMDELTQILGAQYQMMAQLLTAPRVSKLIIDPATGDPIGAESQVVTNGQPSPN